MLNSAVQAIQAVGAVGAMMPNSNSWGNEAEFNDCHRDIVHVCLNGIAEVCDVHVRDMGEEPLYACSSDYETDKGAMCALLVPPDRDTVVSRCIEV